MKTKIVLLLTGLLLSAATGFAEESGTCGENLTWTLSNGTLTISGTGEMTDYDFDGSPWNSNNSITKVIIEDNVTSIGDDAFSWCINLTSITIPESVISIGWRAFFECQKLASISIPNNITSIEDLTFAYCYGLTSVTLPESLTSIGSSAFFYCRNLTSITLPSGVTSIGDEAFASCGRLTAIHVANGNTHYSSEDGVLFNSDKTTLLSYPTGKPDTNYAIPNSVTSIGNSAFSNCDSLISVTIPDDVTSIGEGAFGYCDNLTSITIPNRVTSIDNWAFIWCNNLTSVTIGSSVTSIGNQAFAHCTNLTFVANLNPTPQIINTTNSLVFQNIDLSSVKLYVPSGREAAYRAANVWKNFDIKEMPQTLLLSNLTVDKGNLFPVFNPYDVYYNVFVPKSIENITLQAIPVEGATVSGDGLKALNIGDNIFEIRVTLQEEVSVYTVAVKRMANDYELQLLSFAEVTTGSTMVTPFGLGPYPVIDEIRLNYRLATGNFSGSLPLHFDAGYGKTLDKTIEIDANSMYEFTLRLGLQYYENSKSLSATLHYDSYGNPSSVTLNYKRYENTVTASNGNEELSIYSFDMPGDNIRNVTISALTFIGNTTPTAIAETDAQPAIAVYPNPVKESFRINGIAAPASVIITDLSGRTVLQQTVQSNETIPAGHWPKGVYIVRVNNQSIKFIKN